MDCREYKYRAAQEMGGSDQRFIKRLFMTTVEDTFTMGGSDQRFMKRLFMTPQ